MKSSAPVPTQVWLRWLYSQLNQPLTGQVPDRYQTKEGRKEGRQVNRHIDRLEGRKAIKQEGRHPDRQSGGQVGRLMDMLVGRLPGR